MPSRIDGMKIALAKTTMVFLRPILSLALLCAVACEPPPEAPPLYPRRPSPPDLAPFVVAPAPQQAPAAAPPRLP
jgi:hypothetical protein